jgi:formylglycine-generating enzyme required for sulfatase activity
LADHADHYDVFLSYSHNDMNAAINLRAQFERYGFSVFHDRERIHPGDLWFDRLQEALDACGAFVVLVGRDGVTRWVGAETQVALGRYFGPHDDAERLPIFPILLDETRADILPAFLRLFQATPWDGADAPPDALLKQIRDRRIVFDKTLVFEGCPFVGLAAFRMDQAHLFFGRRKETLDALACFNARAGAPIVRWLEINGNSGTGKSSLMQAGLLPLIDQGWLWAHTGYEHWRRIGPMMPGEHPVEMLAESLACGFKEEMDDVRRRLTGDERALAFWLRSRKQANTAFLLAIDQFQELFTLAPREERQRFDSLLASALEDRDCPLFVISTMRADFLHRFEKLPRLVAVRNWLARSWTLAPIGDHGLRRIIEGPAQLAALNVSEIKDLMVDQAKGEPGALPLVENALYWLWKERTGNRLSGQMFIAQGGLAGILSRSADNLLNNLDRTQRERALEVLFRLVKVGGDDSRHVRQRIGFNEAVDVAGGGEAGRAIINRLAGERELNRNEPEHPRLITVTQDALDVDCKVNLIHETLIHSRVDTDGNMRPYWPTLWNYIEQNKGRAALLERLRSQAEEWKKRKRLVRLFTRAKWRDLIAYRKLPKFAPLRHIERRYLRWSYARAMVEAVVLVAIVGGAGAVAEGTYWASKRGFPLETVWERWAYMLWRDFPLPKLAKVPAGSFMMGTGRKAEEQPVRRVNFAQPFYIGRTEVTFEQWDACVADSACKSHRPPDQGWGRGTRPVIFVDWHEAQAYIAWLNEKRGMSCRLPSEAEWEYAARAHTTTSYALPAPDGSEDIAGADLANCSDCGSQWDGERTAPTGSFPANAWKLHDMHGNAWEWVQDCWHKSYKSAPADGRTWLDQDGGDCRVGVLRGGSWLYDQDRARSAARWGDLVRTDRGYDISFRVVCSSPSSNANP